MAVKTLKENVNQAVNDFKAIKAKIVEKGVPIDSGTPTSEYPQKVDEVHQKAVDNTADIAIESINEQTDRLKTRLNGNSTESQTMYDKVFNDGYTEGVVDGRQAEYDEFWNSSPETRGKISIGTFAGKMWNATTFNPPWDLVAETNINYCFYVSGIAGDLRNIAKKNNVNISFPSVSQALYALANSYITGVPTINISGNLSYMFYSANELIEIEKLIIENADCQFEHAFFNCRKLTSAMFEGENIASNLNTSYSPLDKASLTSIVNALSSTTTGLTVTLRLSAVNSAFETAEGLADGSTSEEWQNLTATKSNWTISLIDS